VFATINEAPSDGEVVVRVTRDGEEVCLLTIESGETLSNVVRGAELAPLNPAWRLGLDVLSVGGGSAGSGLTVSIRT
jgi:hypothetical protein